jgi:hypothetical protein
VVPTFVGRLQTRAFALGVVGLAWTLLVTPFLTVFGPPVADLWEATLFAWAATLIIGVLVWEPLYHGLQQFRWEKDWPTPFLLVEGLPEGIVVWLLRAAIGPDAPADAFVAHFASTWLVVFLAIEGPMRVAFIRWRFRGGQLDA